MLVENWRHEGSKVLGKVAAKADEPNPPTADLATEKRDGEKTGANKSSLV